MGKFSEIAYEMSFPNYDGKYDEGACSPRI